VELEKFSLLKWDRRAKFLTVHRLVQTVVRDRIDDVDLEAFRTVIDICDHAFPERWDNTTTREMCRKYLGQVMRPLLGIKFWTMEETDVLEHVCNFLSGDGKLNDGATLLTKSLEIRVGLGGMDHLSMIQNFRIWASLQ